MRHPLVALCLATLLSGGVCSADPRWTLTSPALPLSAPADQWCEIDLHGPTGQTSPRLGVGVNSWPLQETEPGHYRGRFQPSTGPISLDDQTFGECTATDGTPLGVFECTRKEGILRVGPSSDFDRLTPCPQGARLEVIAKQGDWLQVRPPFAWIRAAEGTMLPAESSVNNPHLTAVKIDERAHVVRFKLGAPCAWQVQEDVEQHRITLDLPGVGSEMHEMSYDQRPQRIRSVRLSPRVDGTRAEITLKDRLWGYGLDSSNGELRLTLTPSPARTLRGLRVTVDAGHGGTDRGTVGLDLKVQEKDLNLAVARALRDELQAAGALVTMTRNSDKQVAPEDAPADGELQSRVDVAERSGAQLFISVHHNARPDVKEGRVSHGTHIYYYTPHSEQLAEEIAAPLARAIGERSWMHLWRSFAVIRQTRMPAVLVECNFLSNPTLEKGMLHKSTYPRDAAHGIRLGAERFVRSR